MLDLDGVIAVKAVNFVHYGHELYESLMFRSFMHKAGVRKTHSRHETRNLILRRYLENSTFGVGVVHH